MASIHAQNVPWTLTREEDPLYKILMTTVVLVGLNTSALSQEISHSQVQLPDGSVLISGKWKKTGIGSVDIPFKYTFKDVNSIVVVVSPSYPSPVGGIETVSKVQADSFQVTSGNAAAEFVLNWMATGK